LAAGAIIGTAATSPYWGYGYGYPDYGYGYPYGSGYPAATVGYGYPYAASGYGYAGANCWVHRRVYNRFGRYVGWRQVNVCS
jgi:hypothetical protein